ncbi:protein bicaudal C homolog 1 isoform X2 [Lampetra planeri]
MSPVQYQLTMAAQQSQQQQPELDSSSPPPLAMPVRPEQQQQQQQQQQLLQQQLQQQQLQQLQQFQQQQHNHVYGERCCDSPASPPESEAAEGACSPEPDSDPAILDPDAAEERFRVDRKKLEAMLQAAVEGKGESGEEFFQKIMGETNTHITWPSKLKIGAKSKKDPHIKVCGKRDNIRDAKEKIMAVLDTKSNRVTLKMDVSHTEHSHVIGKGGANIQRVMANTGCHIHFPDSNRGSQAEKSNQVSIAGLPGGVEEARAFIRELLPLALMFEVPMTGFLQPVSEASSPAVAHIAQRHGLNVAFKQRARLYGTVCVARGSNVSTTKEGVAMLIEHLTGSPGATFPVSSQLDVAPQHHQFMMGRNGLNVKRIVHRTGAQIQFPEPGGPHKAIHIHGNMEAVCLARTCLLGCLPLVLMFDMKEDAEISPHNMAQLMEHLDVFISIKPKPKQPSKSVIVKSMERNAGNVYEARRLLLGLENSGIPIPANGLLNPKMSCPVSLATNATYPMQASGLDILASAGLGLSTIESWLCASTTAACTQQPPVLKSCAEAAPMLSPGALSVATNSALLNILNAQLSPVVTQGSGPPQSTPMWTVSPPGFPALPPVVLSPATQAALTGMLLGGGMTSYGTPSHRMPSPPPGLSPPTPHALHHHHHHQAALASVQAAASGSAATRGAGELVGFNSPSGAASSQGMHATQQGVGGARTFRAVAEQGGAATSLGLSTRPSQSMAVGLAHGESGGVTNCRMAHAKSHGDTGDGGGQGPAKLTPNTSLNGHVKPSERAAGCQKRECVVLSGSRGQLSPKSNTRREPEEAYVEVGMPRSPSHSASSHELQQSLSRARVLHQQQHQQQQQQQQHMQAHAQAQERRLSGTEGDHRDLHTDKRAPGSEWAAERSCADGFRLAPHSPYTSAVEAADYEQKKLMATKAMQKKPVVTEVRTPTSQWSGLGFSKSMPAETIKELRRPNHGSFKPSMPTTFEGDALSESGSESENWRERNGHDSSSGTEFPTSGNSPKRKASVKSYEHYLSSSGYMESMPRTPAGIAGAGCSLGSAIKGSGGGSSSSSSSDLPELFSKLGLGKYTDIFQQQEIDLQTFLSLTDQDLKELGISTFGARRKMLLAISDLNKSRRKLFDSPLRSAFLEGGASGRLPRHHGEMASQSGRW